MLTQTIESPFRENEEGVIYVGKTRVPIDTVVYHHNHGTTPDQIAERYTTLTLSDVCATTAYYLQNRTAVMLILLNENKNLKHCSRKSKIGPTAGYPYKVAGTFEE